MAEDNHSLEEEKKPTVINENKGKRQVMPKRIIISLIVIITSTFILGIILSQQLIGQNDRELGISFRKVQVLIIIFLAAEVMIICVLIWLYFLSKKADEGLFKKYEMIEEQSKRLEEAKTSLEIKIQARTRELQEVAGKLEEQVRDRTKQLQEKIEELEKFSRLAVGRELKMIELKGEITKLKEKLEGPQLKKLNKKSGDGD